MNGAFAGFGLMAAEAAGELCAAHVLGRTLPSYASAFAPARYADPAYPLEGWCLAGAGRSRGGVVVACKLRIVFLASSEQESC